MMIVARKMRMFYTVCRTRQFFRLCRTTCFLSISWTTLSQSTFRTILFCGTLITELQFGIGLWLISSFCYSQKKVLLNWTLLPYAVPVPISPYIPLIYLVKSTNYDATVCTKFFVFFSLCRICQNYWTDNFSHIF